MALKLLPMTHPSSHEVWGGAGVGCCSQHNAHPSVTRNHTTLCSSLKIGEEWDLWDADTATDQPRFCTRSRRCRTPPAKKEAEGENTAPFSLGPLGPGEYPTASAAALAKAEGGGGVAASRISKKARQSRTVVSQNLFGYLDQFPHFCISGKFAVQEDGPVHSKPIREFEHLFGAE